MDFLILVAQRTNIPRGDYEALEVIDGAGNDENPDFMEQKRREAIASRHFDAVAVVNVRVPHAAITAALFPETTPIAGTVG